MTTSFDNEIFFTDDSEDYAPQASFKEITDGIHHVVLKGIEQSIIKAGCETLIGCRQLTWKWCVVEGPCAGANVWSSTPIEGYVISKKNPGQRVNMGKLSKDVLSALEPLRTDFKSFKPEELIGKHAEINLTTKKNTDGTTSLYAGRVHWVRPWFDKGAAGTNLATDSFDQSDVKF